MKVNLQNPLYKQSNTQDIILAQNQSNNLADINNIQNDFKSILKSTNIAATQTVFENLMDKLLKQERMIVKNPNIANINAYRSIVCDILNLASSNFKSTEMELYSNDGYRKFVNASEVIDENLQSLVSDFLETNRISMSTIDSFANIKGLLIDMFI